LICTFHASTAAGAIARLIEMNAEPYQITSAVYGLVAQRLLSRKTDAGYRGRVPIAEFSLLDEPARAAILRRDDSHTLDALISRRTGFQNLRSAAMELVNAKVTDLAEVERVLGTAGK
jgi:type II secretory ATPase GspE/PulE/Tfp pilus assembly ATPase PilB-like protein